MQLLLLTFFPPQMVYEGEFVFEVSSPPIKCRLRGLLAMNNLPPAIRSHRSPRGGQTDPLRRRHHVPMPLLYSSPIWRVSQPVTPRRTAVCPASVSKPVPILLGEPLPPLFNGAIEMINCTLHQILPPIAVWEGIRRTICCITYMASSCGHAHLWSISFRNEFPLATLMCFFNYSCFYQT